jgi:hypothetical protein
MVVVAFTTRPLYRGLKCLRYPLYWRLDLFEFRSWCYGEVKNILHLPGLEPRFLGRPACSSVAMPGELSGLPWGKVLYQVLANKLGINQSTFCKIEEANVGGTWPPWPLWTGLSCCWLNSIQLVPSYCQHHIELMNPGGKTHSYLCCHCLVA